MRVAEQTLIDTALKFVGVHEQGGNNNGPEVEEFQRIISRPVSQPWCCDFVQYCVSKVDKYLGTKTALFRTEAVVVMWMNTPKAQRVQEPFPGAVVCWGHYNVYGNPTGTGHTGIVKEVLAGGSILTIEGNTPPSGDEISRDSGGRVADGVYIKRRASHVTSGSMRTLGYLRPWV